MSLVSNKLEQKKGTSKRKGVYVFNIKIFSFFLFYPTEGNYPVVDRRSLLKRERTLSVNLILIFVRPN